MGVTPTPTESTIPTFPSGKLNEGNGTIRLDHNFSSNDSAFARFSYDQANSYVPGGSPSWAEQNPFGSNQLIANHARNVVISETHVVNSRNINQAYFGFNRIFDHITSYGEFGGQLCDSDSSASSVPTSTASARTRPRG